jgi:hypothetical protein
MKSRTKVDSYSPVSHHCVVNPLGVTQALVSICVGGMLCGPVLDASALPPADEVLQEFRISDSDRQRIRKGEIVTWTATEGSDRELALGMVLLVKTKPENLTDLFREAATFMNIKVITGFGKIGNIGFGKIENEGTLADFAGVTLAPNGEKEARRYLEVEPGDDLNLDAKEMAAFRALNSASKDGVVPIQKVEALIREGLLARYQAYHTKGLAGVAPYARKSGPHLLASDELSIATKQSKLLARYLPSVYDVLIKYPATALKQGEEFEEQFLWINSEVFGRPTFALSHRMLFQVGEAYVFVDRQYYASHEYNCLQQGAAALPTGDGTVVVYLSRVSTEQVAGFGSSMKHSASRVLMTPYFKDLLEALRAKAEKP